MALSDIQICNMGLSHAGSRSSIESFNEASTEAAQCKIWYSHSRQQALEMFNWNFARKRATLSLHAEAAPDGVWAFRYTYPADCISAREIENPLGPDADAMPFEIETDSNGFKSILTNVEDAKLIYTFDQKNPNTFTTFFTSLLAWVLASNVTYSLTGKQSNVDRALNNVLNLQIMAPAMDANERVDRKPREAEAIRFRNGESRVANAPITRST